MFKSQSFRLKRSRPYEDVHHTCTIQFIDESDSLSVTYQKDTKGQFLIDYSCQHLDLIEKDYFALFFYDPDRTRTWLDPVKTVQKQLKGLHSPILYFGVKFYPSDPSKLKEEITRYQLFLQLRKDLRGGALLVTPEESIRLAAYVVQAELGDFDSDEHLPDYVSQVKYLPKQAYSREKDVSAIHKTLAGQSPAEAEANFLKEASQITMAYGMTPYSVTDVKGNNLHLGISHQGIATFQNGRRTHMFTWSQIKRISFDGRLFIVRLFNVEPDDASLLMKRSHSSCGFKCSTTSAAKNLWKSAVEQQYFYTLKAGSEAPKAVTSGGLFHRGSKFRFSGRSEKEVYTSTCDIKRHEPTFQRSPANAELARTYSNLRSATLPASWKQQKSSSPILEKHVADSMASKNSNESGYAGSSKPASAEEILSATLAADDKKSQDNKENLKPAKADDVEDLIDMVVEEPIVVARHAPRCGERDDTIPKLDFTNIEADSPAPVKDKKPSDRSAYISSAISDFEAGLDFGGDDFLKDTEMKRTTKPTATGKVPLITHDLDNAVSDLRNRLETDLERKKTPSNVSQGHDVEVRKTAGYVGGTRGDSTGYVGGTRDSIPTTSSSSTRTPTPSEPTPVEKVPAQSFSTKPVTAAAPVAAKPVVRKQGGGMCGWKFLLAVLVAVFLIIAVLVLEIRADFPVITDIRNIAEVEQFRVEHYAPFRSQIDDWINEYLG